MKRRHFVNSGVALAMPLFSSVAGAQSGQTSKSSPTTHSYGQDPNQQVDVYLPKGDCLAWVLMVHGGGWRRGDKAMPRTIDNKAARWNAKGVAVVSMNYRMLPQSPVEEQIADVRSALSFLQRKSSTLGLVGPMVLMGHSAGAHLVAMVSSQAQRTRDEGIAPWAATVLLDSGALDVPKTMERTRLPLYKNAFGPQSLRWTQLSPMHQIQSGVGPTLVVYSTTRRDDIEQQSQMYAQRLAASGVRAVQLLGVQLDHGQVNEQLGLDNDYTRAVEQFLSTINAPLNGVFKR